MEKRILVSCPHAKMSGNGIVREFISRRYDAVVLKSVMLGRRRCIYSGVELKHIFLDYPI